MSSDSDNIPCCEELLETDNSVSGHHRNIQVLATELYKIVNEISPKIMKEVFPFNENMTYDTRNKRKFHLRAIKLDNFGSEMISHVPAKIWELVSVEIKNVELIAFYKRAIEKWKPMELSLSSMPDLMFLTLVSCNLFDDTSHTFYFVFIILLLFVILDS